MLGISSNRGLSESGQRLRSVAPTGRKHRILFAAVAVCAVVGSAEVATAPVTLAAPPPASSQLVPASSHDVPVGSATYVPNGAKPNLASGGTRTNSDGTSFETNGSSTAPTGLSRRFGASSQAAAVRPSVPWICSVYTSDPTKTVESGKQVIYGDSDQLCSGGGYVPLRTVTSVEQYRGLGVWTIKDQYGDPQEYGTDHSFASAWWTCAAGTGSQLYRIIGDNYADAGAYEQSVQSQNYLRATCPS